MTINFFVVWLTDERRLALGSNPQAGFEPAQNLSLGFVE